MVERFRGLGDPDENVGDGFSDDLGDDWSEADDIVLREALDSLREDVIALPLAPPQQIKERGARRRRATWLTAGAGLAAAGLVVAGVGLSGVLRPDDRHTDPATTSRTTTSMSSSSSVSTTSAEVDWEALLAASGALLPTGKEWQGALRLSREPKVAAASSTGGVEDPLCAMPSGAAMLVDASTVTAAGQPSAFAAQRVWISGSDGEAQDALNSMRDALEDCSTPLPTGGMTPVATSGSAEAGWVWRYAVDSGTAWLALAASGRHITYVEVWDPPQGETATEEMTRLAWVAGQRLARYGDDGSSSTGGARAIAGPSGRTPDPELFVDPAVFASPLLTEDAAVESAAGEFEGSPVVTQGCDADTSDSGTFGLMKVKVAGKDASFFATQRIRQVSEGQSVQEVIDALTTGFDGCSVRSGQTTTTATAGAAAGQYVVTTTFDDASEPITEFVVVTATKTPGYVSTISTWVAGPEVNHEPYLAELQRLGALAAQR